MCSAALLIACTFTALAYSKGEDVNSASNLNTSTVKLGGKLFTPAFDASSIYPSNLDRTMLGKSSKLMMQASTNRRPLRPLRAKSNFRKGSDSGPTLSNPFAVQKRRRSTSVSSEPIRFIRPDVDSSKLLTINDADRLLSRFHRYSTLSTRKPALKVACRSVAAHSRHMLMGICAHDFDAGIAALKGWVADLGLPKGKLYGMDDNGVALPPPDGPVYMKYNSRSGDVHLSKYNGKYRGVLLTPKLKDGQFRQFGHLPLDLHNAPIDNEQEAA
eukprot:gnl/TRDRNA2_/TRDRNA2_188347_c0_seq1.p1 gnl/TRDRNA2_/TRDRNA2_188347_c0~~gnl/TRDRNA2_/TRDRNA2_188347_c0_seq1.p1  ORF type:complete len:272 (+),score=28.44 gnl/TRDRNA2_/TRDRNA2_188347_c0_seq1:50-865(+)